MGAAGAAEDGGAAEGQKPGGSGGLVMNEAMFVLHVAAIVLVGVSLGILIGGRREWKLHREWCGCPTCRDWRGRIWQGGKK